MPKTFITKDVVRNAVAPERGEIWISDTVIKGFGLRVYKTRNGTRKILNIRVRDNKGLLVRKAFPLDDFWNRELHRYDVQSYEQYREFERKFISSEFVDLEKARKWARNEIRTLKGLPTIESEDRARRKKAERILQRVTLERGARAILRNLERMKVSDRYRDQLSKLFYNSIPKHLQDICIPDFSPKEAQQLLTAMELSPGNRRTLSSFVGRIFDIALSWGVSGLHYFEARGNWQASGFAISAPNDHTIHIEDAEFIKLFSVLESQQESRSQALCLRIYFDTHAPLTRVMKARWQECGFHEVNSFFSNKKQTVLIWRYSSKFGRFGRVQGSAMDLLVAEHARLQNAETFCDYCFPSRRGHSHIRSVQHVWQLALSEVGIKYMSPRKLRTLYQETELYHDAMWT